jgi:hypothetical protein
MVYVLSIIWLFLVAAQGLWHKKLRSANKPINYTVHNVYRGAGIVLFTWIHSLFYPILPSLIFGLFCWSIFFTIWPYYVNLLFGQPFFYLNDSSFTDRLFQKIPTLPRLFLQIWILITIVSAYFYA